MFKKVERSGPISDTCSTCYQIMELVQLGNIGGADDRHCHLRLVDLEAHENQISHETQGLCDNHLVVRRGKPFKLTLMFQGRWWNPYSHRLVLEVYLGTLSQSFPVLLRGEWSDPKSWSAAIHPENKCPSSVSVHICSPVLSSVGLYNLFVHIDGRRTFKVGKFVLLCNPWLQDDPVYMPLDVYKEECVKNDYGVLYMGSHANLCMRPWSFGQYEPGVLEACLKLLQVSPEHLSNSCKDYTLRGDPVYLSRVVAAMVNCNDDSGILQGKWEGSYAAGVKPTDWSGSAAILRQWVSSNCRPVRYGQCWVFASVLCTVMRVLGIPSRVVTVFNAAHDSNGNATIEEYYSSGGEKLNMSKDSIWNFHVWVECWMTRPDLSPEFDGWQVVDPTPQEKSAGRYCCGPCPVAAIQQHCFLARYDALFLYASVDADVIRVIVHNGWVVRKTVDVDRVGKFICTKSIGSDRPQDLTKSYKGMKNVGAGMKSYRSDSSCYSNAEMRQGFTLRTSQMPFTCRQFSSVTLNRDVNLFSTAEDGEVGMPPSLDVSLSVDGIPLLGESIRLCVTVTNKSSGPRTLIAYVNAQLKEYNCTPQQSFWRTQTKVHVAPRQVLALHHTIVYSEYESVLSADDIVNVAVVIMDTRTSESALDAQEISMRAPHITIEIEGGDSVQLRTEHIAHVAFTNTFGAPLTGAVLSVEGYGLLQRKEQVRLMLLAPGKKIEKKVSIMATSPGTKLLVATVTHSDSSNIVSRSYQKISVTAA